MREWQRLLDRGIAVCAIVIAILATGCGGPREPERRFELTGSIVSVDQERQQVTIRHDEIPGYMEPMTMPFRVKDSRMMVALAPGRSVVADLVVAGKESWIENIVVGTAAGMPSMPSRIEGATEPVPGEPAPDFALTDQNGAPATLGRFRGKAIALTFIYTRCPLPDFCPLMTNNFAAVDDALARDASLASRAQLLSISIDPEYDSPAVLREYARQFAARDNGRVSENWAFLTGTGESVRKTAQSYGLAYEPDRDQIIHSLRTAIIGSDGTLIKVYRGNEWVPEEVVRDLAEAAKVGS